MRAQGGVRENSGEVPAHTLDHCTDEPDEVRPGTENAEMSGGSLVYLFHLFTFAGAGEVSQSGHGCQGEALDAEEP